MRAEHIDLSNWDTSKLDLVSQNVLEHCSKNLKIPGAVIWSSSSEARQLKGVIHSCGGPPVRFNALDVSLEFRWPPSPTPAFRDDSIFWIRREPKFTFLVDLDRQDDRVPKILERLVDDLASIQPLIASQKPPALLFPRGVFVENTQLEQVNLVDTVNLLTISKEIFGHKPDVEFSYTG